MPALWSRFAAPHPIEVVFTGAWVTGGFPLSSAEGLSLVAVRKSQRSDFIHHSLFPSGTAERGQSAPISRDGMHCIGDRSDVLPGARQTGIDDIALDWSMRLGPALTERAAAMRAERAAWFGAESGRVTWFGEPLLQFPELPDAAGFAAIRQRVHEQGQDVELADLYLGEAEGHASAYRFAAWAELAAADSTDGVVAARFRAAADACARLGNDTADPARFAAAREFYSVVALLWSEGSHVRRAWDAYVAVLNALVRDPAGAKKQARTLPDIQNRITRALGQSGVDPHVRWQENQRNRWSQWSELVRLAPHELLDVCKGKDDLARQAALVAREYFREARPLRDSGGLENRLVKPLGHAWENVSRVLLIGGCPEALETAVALVHAMELAELRLHEWGGSVPSERIEEWKQRKFLPIQWQKMLEGYIAGVGEQRSAWRRQRIVAIEELIAWLAQQPVATSAALRGNELWWALSKRQGRWDDVEMNLEKPAVALAYVQVIEALNAAIAWLRRQSDVTTEGLATNFHWQALHHVELHRVESAKAIAADCGVLAEAYAAAANAESRYAAWYAQRGIVEVGEIHYRITTAWVQVIQAIKDRNAEMERLWKRTAAANQELLEHVELWQTHGVVFAKHPEYQLGIKASFSLANAAQYVAVDPRGAAEWEAYANTLVATKIWYRSQSVAGALPTDMNAEWQKRRAAIDASWADLQQRYPAR